MNDLTTQASNLSVDETAFTNAQSAAMSSIYQRDPPSPSSHAVRALSPPSPRHGSPSLSRWEAGSFASESHADAAEAMDLMKHRKFEQALVVLTRRILSTDFPSSADVYNRSLCLEQLGRRAEALQDALTAFELAEQCSARALPGSEGGLSLRHFRRVARCQMGMRYYPAAKRTLIKAELFESRSVNTHALLSESTLNNERVKLTDLQRELSRIMMHGDGKNAAGRRATKGDFCGPTFALLPPALATQLAPEPLTASAWGDASSASASGSVTTSSAGASVNASSSACDRIAAAAALAQRAVSEDAGNLAAEMTLWDARVGMRQVRRERRRAAEAKELERKCTIQHPAVCKLESLYRLSTRKKSPVLFDHGAFTRSNSREQSFVPVGGTKSPSPERDAIATATATATASGVESPKRSRFPLPTPLAKGLYKRTEFPRYYHANNGHGHPRGDSRGGSRGGSRDNSSNGGGPTVSIRPRKRSLRRLEAQQESGHLKYVHKDKMQLCRLVSVLGRDNEQLLKGFNEPREGLRGGDLSSSDDCDSYSEEEVEAEESDGEGGVRTVTTRERRQRPQSMADTLIRQKSMAIQLLDKKMMEQNFNPIDTHVRFPGLIS